jgi:4-hydroxybenzoyl-CoA reductase subunit beta
MKMPPFQVYSPTTLKEALTKASELSDSGNEFDWVAGGTDLLPNYKWHIDVKKHVISLAAISELHKLSETHIGAMVRIHDLASSENTHSVLAKAADSIASVMIRRSGTVGGNICLDTRCYWFNQSETWRESIDWCYKCDCGTEADCRVIPNQNTLCVATYQADLAPVLLCLDAIIHLASPSGTRSMPLEDFFELDGITRNVLGKDELVTHLTLPDDSGEWEGDYQKLRQRESWDFPEAGVAVLWKSNGNGIPSALRVATTGLESIPGIHTQEVDAVMSDWKGEESIDELAESVRKSVNPVKNTWFSPSYRRKMVKVLTRRACRGLLVR